MTQKGRLVIISGPSGSGKSTVLQKLFQNSEIPLMLSVSATTRPPRPGEKEGRDYYFLSDEEFQRRRNAGEFLECKEVFGRGYWYGTLRDPVSTGLNDGKWVILEIDVQGALAVLRDQPEAITIFVHPGSMAELEKRLRNRGTESEEAIQRRLNVAAEELALRHHYTHEVINQEINTTVQHLCQLLTQYHGETIPCSKN
ncbi:MAG: guanylate kinase [Pirellula sp.]|jgi:guanylate kinase|nr:guanylate kinase [Pirellula sp.]